MKYDSGKPRVGLVLLGFKHALIEVSKVGTFGVSKYAENSWQDLENAESRYTDALYRHLLASGETDNESGLDHLAHAAWNILALLEFKYGRN
jgi:hypothetical protein